jgi:hypothetical protein
VRSRASPYDAIDVEECTQDVVHRSQIGCGRLDGERDVEVLIAAVSPRFGSGSRSGGASQLLPSRETTLKRGVVKLST